MTDSQHSISTAALLALMALLYYLMFLFTPLQVDDLMFAQEYMAVNNGSPEFSLHGFREYILFIRDQINGRLPNMVCAVWVLHLHHAVGSMLLAIATVWMFMAMNRLAAGRLSLTALSFAWIIGAALLPWRSGMFITDIALNYIPVSLALLWLYREFTSPTGIRLWVVLPIVFVTALLHEGADIIAIAACGAYALMRRMCLSRRQWAMAGVFLAGTALLLSSPGIWLRFDGAYAAVISHKSVVMGIPATMLLLLAILLVTALKPWRGYTGELLRSPKWLGCVAAAIVGALMQWRLGFAFERGGWFGELFACTALLMLITTLAQRLGRRVVICATALSIILPAALLCGSIVMQYRADKENSAILQLLRQSPTGTVFHDLHPRSSRLLLNYPMTYTWLNPDHLLIVNNGHSTPVAVVPEELSRASLAAMTTVAGNVGALSFGNSYMLPDRQLNMLDAHGLPYPNCPIELTSYTYTCADGTVHPDVKTLLQRFTLPDGTRMLLIRPLVLSLNPPFVNILRVDGAEESPRADGSGRDVDTVL